jgi:hypothetical protein
MFIFFCMLYNFFVSIRQSSQVLNFLSFIQYVYGIANVPSYLSSKMWYFLPKIPPQKHTTAKLINIIRIKKTNVQNYKTFRHRPSQRQNAPSCKTIHATKCSKYKTSPGVNKLYIYENYVVH